MKLILLILTLTRALAQDIFIPFLEDPVFTGNNLRNNLVAYWRFYNFQQASPVGDEPSDVNGYTLIQNPSANLPSSGSGRVGLARGFSAGAGSEDYFSGNFASSAFAFSGDFTIAGWGLFQPKSPATDDFTIISRGNSGTTPGDYNFSYLFEVDSGSSQDYIAFYWSFNGQLVATNRVDAPIGDVTGTDWYFFYVRRAGTTMYVSATYSGEALQPEGNKPNSGGAFYVGPASPFLPVRVGKWSDSSVHDMNGFIDEMGIWNRSLSPCELKYLYSARHGIFTFKDLDTNPCANPPP